MTMIVDMSEISVGDIVRQVAPVALGNLYEDRHVVEVLDRGLLLSKEVGGPPMTDLRGLPMVYPREKFFKLN